MIITWLLERGLDSTIENLLGQLPRELATSKAVKELLPEKMGHPQFDLFDEDVDYLSNALVNGQKGGGDEQADDEENKDQTESDPLFEDDENAFDDKGLIDKSNITGDNRMSHLGS
mmetsp:Transcript_25000/g.22103  ORF Transcript_25000/g.22103 Transcript_25000/m.22103 type:complete len:116 (+) Transcript_25000:464-811(+)